MIKRRQYVSVVKFLENVIYVNFLIFVLSRILFVDLDTYKIL